VQVKKGKWVRLDPKDSSAKDGFHCSKVVKVEGDFGTGNVDPTRTH